MKDIIIRTPNPDNDKSLPLDCTCPILNKRQSSRELPDGHYWITGRCIVHAKSSKESKAQNYGVAGSEPRDPNIVGRI